MSEFMQPIRPLRIVQELGDHWFTSNVFAVRVVGRDAEYLTIDGKFYNSREISFAETQIDGAWVRMKVLTKTVAS